MVFFAVNNMFVAAEESSDIPPANRFDKAIEDINDRMTNIERRIAALEKSVDRRFAGGNDRFISLQNDIRELRGCIRDGLKGLSVKMVDADIERTEILRELGLRGSGRKLVGERR